jgi:hypothetical protein
VAEAASGFEWKIIHVLIRKNSGSFTTEGTEVTEICREIDRAKRCGNKSELTNFRSEKAIS